jgi:hypothetical protein
MESVKAISESTKAETLNEVDSLNENKFEIVEQKAENEEWVLAMRYLNVLVKHVPENPSYINQRKML